MKARTLGGWLVVVGLMVTGGPVVGGGGGTYYVATDGDDDTGDGSVGNPWATITGALDAVPDDSLVLVEPGLYFGRVRIRGTFPIGVTVRSAVPYGAQLRNDDRVITAYQDGAGCEGITLEGFDVAHDGPGASPLVVHIDGGGNGSVHHITLRDNVLHDSYDNDILKINNSTHDILVEGNLFYNQTGSDEHIDLNSVEDVVVQDNVFFNDFEGSGRVNDNSTSSFIVIKDSNQGSDLYLGSRNVTVRRNVFLNWQGNSGSNFLLLGEDGHPIYEAREILVENNLMLGNSVHVMRSAFGVKGGRDITFRNNTVVGDLPALAFAMRLVREGSNPINDEIAFYNNIWSDPTGSMGANGGGSNDFSDTSPGDTADWDLDHNLYWNGGTAIPDDAGELINYTDDVNRVVGNPELALLQGIVLPRWVPQPAPGQFADGSDTIRQVFLRLVGDFGRLGPGSLALDAGDVATSATEDILGAVRIGTPDLGAWEAGVLFVDGFESGDTTAWTP